MTIPAVHDTLRRSERDLQSLCAELDRDRYTPAPRNAGAAKRQLRRWPVSNTRALVSLSQPHGGTNHFVVAPRNLSAGGLAAIHGGFLHPGSACTVTLRSLDCANIAVTGVIRFCRHLRAHLHEFGIKFHDPIDPKRFLRFDDEPVFNAENVDVASLTGAALIAATSRHDQRLLAGRFAGSQLDLLFADSRDAALAMLSDEPDLALIDMDSPSHAGVQLVAELRDAGFLRPILLLTAEPDPELRAHAKALGATEVLTKPVAASTIHEAVADCLHLSGGASTGGGDGVGPIVSSAAAAGLDLDIVCEAERGIRAFGEQLRDALDTPDFDEIRRLAYQIRALAQSFGFARLADAADELAAACARDPRGPAVTRLAQRLRDYAARAKAVR